MPSACAIHLRDALFGTPEYPHLAAADIDLCADVDRFDFCLRVEREDGLLVMRPVRADTLRAVRWHLDRFSFLLHASTS